MKKAFIFDLDNTLINTNAQAHIISPNGDIHQSFTTSLLRDNKGNIKEYLNNGYTINFNEIGDNSDLSYNFLMNGTEINQHFNYFNQKVSESNNNVFILTGRGNKPESIHRFIFDKWNINFLLNNIYTVSYQPLFNQCFQQIKDKYEKHPIFSSFFYEDEHVTYVQKKKKILLFHIITEGNYTELEFYDDDFDNIIEANELKNELSKYDEWKDIQLNIHHVS